MQFGFKQRFFTKASFKFKSKWANEQEISYKKGSFCYFFLVSYIKNTFNTIDIRKSPILDSLRHPINKAS